MHSRIEILLIVMGVFCALLAVLDSSVARPCPAAGVSAIPGRIGDWKSIEVPVYGDTRAVLQTDQVLMREYNRGPQRLLLAVVYYPDSRVALHLPESCYTGQGSQIVERRTERIGTVDANLFFLEGTRGNKIVLYYFVTGDCLTGSYGAMRLRMMKNRFLGKNTGCALVRLTMQRNESVTGDVRILRAFAQQLNAVLPRHLR